MVTTGSIPSTLQKVGPQCHARGLRRSRSPRTGIRSPRSTAPRHLCNFLMRHQDLMAIRAMFPSTAAQLSEQQNQASPTSPCPIQVHQLSQRSTGTLIAGVRIGIICHLQPGHSVAKSTRRSKESTRPEKRAWSRRKKPRIVSGSTYISNPSEKPPSTENGTKALPAKRKPRGGSTSIWTPSKQSHTRRAQGAIPREVWPSWWEPAARRNSRLSGRGTHGAPPFAQRTLVQVSLLRKPKLHHSHSRLPKIWEHEMPTATEYQHPNHSKPEKPSKSLDRPGSFQSLRGGAASCPRSTLRNRIRKSCTLKARSQMMRLFHAIGERAWSASNR
jgi:hypothetical protein